MTIMWTTIIKNNGLVDIEIPDIGITILASSQLTLSNQYEYAELASSDDLRDFVSSSDLVVNNGTSDLSAPDGVEYLTFIHSKYLNDNFYTKVQLQTSGQSQVNWENIINAPKYGVNSWSSPVDLRVLEVTATAPISPNPGDAYVDTTDDKYYIWNGTSWVDSGSVVTGSRVIDLSDAQQSIKEYSGTAWVDQGVPPDASGVSVNNDGDGKTSIYIYELENNSYSKIMDVDFVPHFSPTTLNVHNANQIDVEGDYTSITTAPDDLEAVISEIDTLLTDLISGEYNTLDKAYDQGTGSGDGRIVTVDAGSVKLDATSGTYSPLELTQQTALPSTDLAAGQISFVGGLLYAYDGTRTKFLSVDRQTLAFGRNGNTRNQFLNHFVGALASNNSGQRILRNATITGVTCQLDASGTCTINIRKNDSVTNIATLTVAAALGAQDATINVDLSAGDYLQCYLSSGADVADPVVILEVAYR